MRKVIQLAVANKTIIRKMKSELQKAMTQEDNHKILKQHISNVKLLCELILDEVEEDGATVATKSEISTQEMKAMLGEQYALKNRKPKQNKAFIDHGQANGDSIFDF